MQNPPSGELCSSVGLADISPSQLVGMLTQKNKVKKIVCRQLHICAFCALRKSRRNVRLASNQPMVRSRSLSARAQPLISSRSGSAPGQLSRRVGRQVSLRSAAAGQLRRRIGGRSAAAGQLRRRIGGWSAAAGQLRWRAARPDLRLQGGELALHVGVGPGLVEFLLDVVGVTPDVFQDARLQQFV
jgi:hypothetical protein